ncbi:MAG: hypothetical protein R3266_10530, partial [Gemmatimonadota bacterium]|nr:hypothetical protein [Gemmatimonadota bacterium]
ARALGAPDSEAALAIDLVGRALAHPVLRRAAHAGAADPGAVRREVPLYDGSESGLVISGVADLAFRTRTDAGPEWTVVDYKTDRSVDSSREAYLAQVAEYARLVEAATGEPARGVVLAL